LAGAGAVQQMPYALALQPMALQPVPVYGAAQQQVRARSHCRFVRPLTHFIPYSLTYLVPLFLTRQCDRTLQQLPYAVVAATRAMSVISLTPG
jgi:hypothetical protein